MNLMMTFLQRLVSLTPLLIGCCASISRRSTDILNDQSETFQMFCFCKGSGLLRRKHVGTIAAIVAESTVDVYLIL